MLQDVSHLLVYGLGLAIVFVGAYYARWTVKDSMAKDAEARRLRALREHGE